MWATGSQLLLTVVCGGSKESTDPDAWCARVVKLIEEARRETGMDGWMGGWKNQYLHLIIREVFLEAQRQCRSTLFPVRPERVPLCRRTARIERLTRPQQRGVVGIEEGERSLRDESPDEGEVGHASVQRTLCLGAEGALVIEEGSG